MIIVCRTESIRGTGDKDYNSSVLKANEIDAYAITFAPSNMCVCAIRLREGLINFIFRIWIYERPIMCAYGSAVSVQLRTERIRTSTAAAKGCH